MPSIEDLIGLQNPDGGWSYRRGGSWTEPTCYALLALTAAGMGQSPEAMRGASWLARCQRKDGGLAPRESVEESTWITALASLLPSEMLIHVDYRRAEEWILAQTGRESGWVYRLRMLLSGSRRDVSTDYDGWPWYPGAAAWVAPTAISVLALEKMKTRRGGEAGGADAGEIERRLREGRSFLLIRRCRDGGWNHGSTKALGYDSDSYPESTGLALLALNGVRGPEVAKGIEVGRAHLERCQSPEAASWLELGLLAHGQEIPHKSVEPASGASHGGTLEIALSILAQAAVRGRNLFLSDTSKVSAR